jgi:protocatechuate 3,4-dioxygenase beta subunit
MLAKGSYGLVAEAEGYSPVNDQITLGRDETRDLRLMPAARIYGRVVERGSRQPVPDAEVWVVTDRRFNQPPPRDVKTDENGNFAFNDLPPGTYGVSARKTKLVGYSKMVSASAMQAVTDVEVQVDPGLTIRGKVVDKSGGPIAGVRLSLYKQDPPFDRGSSAKSGADGTFQLEGVLAGRYGLSTTHDGHAPARKDLRVGAQDVDGVIVKLTPAAKITGEVVTADGRPAAGARVNAQMTMKMDGGGMMSTMRGDKSGDDGKFTIKDLEPARVSVTAKHEELGSGTSESFTLAEGETKTVKIVLGGGASIAGVVKYDDGTPAAGVHVIAIERINGMGFGSLDEVTAADGKYRLTGLRKGNVEVTIRQDNASTPVNKSVTLADGEQKTGVDLELPKPGLKIAGTVVTADGKPVTGASVTALVEHDGRVMRFGGRPERAVLSGDDGSFTIDDVSKGTYTVSAFHGSHPDGEAKGVQAGATGVRVVMPAGASIAGIAVSASGQPVTDYAVSLLPGPAGKETPMERNRRLNMGAFENPVRRVHDPAGAFAFDRIKAGSYELKVTTSDGRSGSETVSLQDGEQKTGVRVALAAGVRVTGRVLDVEGGKPIAGASVAAVPLGTISRGDQVKTDGEGGFVVENVPSDQPLRLTVNTEGYLPDYRELEAPKGKSQVDVGAVKLLRGDQEAMFGPPADRGTAGLGAANRDGHAVVSNVGKGTPAEKAGIKTGDAILAIDGRDVRELGGSTLGYLLRGKAGSSVTVEVQTAGGETRKVTITRAEPPPPPR